MPLTEACTYASKKPLELRTPLYFIHLMMVCTAVVPHASTRSLSMKCLRVSVGLSYHYMHSSGRLSGYTVTRGRYFWATQV